MVRVKKFFGFMILGMALLALPAAGFAAEGAAWGYSGKTAPKYWSTLSDDYAACAGKNQAPVDLRKFVEADLPPLSLSYLDGGKVFLNNGHTVQVNFNKGSKLMIDGTSFELKQFHFHTPSENMINTRHYPMELHLVHADFMGNIAVIGVMFTYGDTHEGLEKLVKLLPQKKGDERKFEAAFNAKELLPEDLDYYRFSGSLTTPPCTEGVRWFVLKEPVPVSRAQIKAFSKAMGDNNRPVQPLNARQILK